MDVDQNFERQIATDGIRFYYPPIPNVARLRNDVQLAQEPRKVEKKRRKAQPQKQHRMQQQRPQLDELLDEAAFVRRNAATFGTISKMP